MAKRTNRPRKAAENELSDDGVITITIKGGDNDGKQVAVDLMAARIAVEPIEKKYKVRETDWAATPEFLGELSAVTASFLGLSSCSSAFAYQLWHLVSTKWIELKKNIAF